MANQGTPVVINGSTFYIPVAGQNPQWGDDLHDTVVALATVAGAINPPGTITPTSFTLANNVASAANITGASFDVSLIQSFELSYSIFRSTSSNEGAQTGKLTGTFKRMANTWDMANEFNGTAGIVFSITNVGQIQYTSSNLAGSSYAGIIKFSATAILQA
jgi:hypothetical protein